MKYRRRPVDVVAVQFDPNLPNNQWPPGVSRHSGHWSDKPDKPPTYGFIAHGIASRIVPGDWVVTNQTGERYVVLQESFDATYEMVGVGRTNWVDELKVALVAHNLHCVGEPKSYYPPDAEGPGYRIGKGTGEPCGECSNCKPLRRME